MFTPSQHCYEFGPFRLDAVERILLRDNQVVPLKPKTFEVLLALVERHGHLIEKDELMQTVWPDAFVEEANLSRHVFTLRKALDDDANGFRYIETVPRRGYRFVASVREIREEPAALIAGDRSRSGVLDEQRQETSVSENREAIESRVSRKAARRRINAGWVVAAAALVIVTAAAFVYFRPPPVLTERDSVLITDFVNTTEDTVFDGTLKLALAVKLEESPFLNVVPDQQTRETLRLMLRSSDDPVTRDVGREICERLGIKAMIVSAIARLDRHYAITLEAINAQTGEILARQVAEAKNKDEVLTELGRAATKLREKLGESLSSIQRFNTPLEQATTSSLDALKVFSQGNYYQRQARYLEAIRLHQRATDLDSNFALANARLSAAYTNIGQQEQAVKAAEKAFELRERVSEREKFVISSQYHLNVTRDFDELIRVLELWKSAYPRDANPFGMRGVFYALMGQHEKAIEEYREAVRLEPNSVQTPHNLATSLMILNRFEEAKQSPGILPGSSVLCEIAFAEGNASEMKRQIDAAISRGNEDMSLRWQARVAVFSGRLREAQELNRRAIDLAVRRNLRGRVDTYASGVAHASATLGQCQLAHEGLSEVSAPPQNPVTFLNMGIALALCGEIKRAESLIDERIRQYPNDKVVNEALVPLIQSAIEIVRGNPTKAIRILEDASRYKSSDPAGVHHSYLLGQAYLGERKGAEAAGEFQYILDHRGQAITSVLYPLAHLGLARAATLQGDSANARKAYQDFFELWKNADPEIPILIEAKKEYAKLR